VTGQSGKGLVAVSVQAHKERMPRHGHYPTTKGKMNNRRECFYYKNV